MIPRDCVVSQDEAENERMLEYMGRVLEADVRPSPEIKFQHVARKVSHERQGTVAQIS